MPISLVFSFSSHRPLLLLLLVLQNHTSHSMYLLSLPETLYQIQHPSASHFLVCLSFLQYHRRQIIIHHHINSFQTAVSYLPLQLSLFFLLTLQMRHLQCSIIRNNRMRTCMAVDHIVCLMCGLLCQQI